MTIATSIETYTGARVDLADPIAATFCIEDIAYQLSRQPRFVGATTCNIVYNVAQHSVLVLNRVRATVKDASATLLVCALLHDAHEAYIGDISRPMEQLMDLRLPIERLKYRMQQAIYKGLLKDWRYDNKKFEPYVGDEIQKADDWAGSYEAYHLMHSKGSWHVNTTVLEEEFIMRNFHVWTASQAHDSFLNHYRDLTS